MVGKWQVMLVFVFVFVCATVSISQGNQRANDWEERILNVLKKLKHTKKPKLDRVPDHVQDKWNDMVSGQNQETGQNQGTTTNPDQASDSTSSGGIGDVTNSEAANSETVSDVANQVTDAVEDSTSEIIERIKKGEITDADTIFGYLTYDTFNWDNETCVKCMMEDFKREINACYEGKISAEPGSEQMRGFRRKRSDSYNCYWCGSCYK